MNRRLLAALACVAVALTLIFSVTAAAGSVSSSSIAKRSTSSLTAATTHVIGVASVGKLSLSKKTTYVYITRTGAKYHRSGCRYLKKSKIKVTLKWAKQHGYTPCKVCKPPKK